ncbi:MAG: ABC transporter permease, partial [Candidatus Acidiferrales bacterium]
GYFRALGIDLLRGRLFEEDDDARIRKVAVVSETFVRKYFPSEDPIGKRLGPGARVLTLGGPAQPAPPEWTTIVGVVRDVRTDAVDLEAAPLIYRPEWEASSHNITLTVRTEGDPAALAESIRREVRAVDPNVPVYGVRTMETVVASALSQRRFTMLVLACFAATAFQLHSAALRSCARKFLDVKLALAAKVDNFPSGKKRPIGDYACRGGALHEFRIANRVRLSSANRGHHFG